jgi:hypothetical protein
MRIENLPVFPEDLSGSLQDIHQNGPEIWGTVPALRIGNSSLPEAKRAENEPSKLSSFANSRLPTIPFASADVYRIVPWPMPAKS